MNVINREFKELASGEIYKVIDVYQNLAVAKLRGTNTTERIVVTRLIDPKFYLPMDGHLSTDNILPIDESKKFTIHTDDYVDPKKFFNESNTLALFADQIKSIPEDRLPREDIDIPVTTSHMSNDMVPSMSESAIIIDNDYDEAEEIARKYGVSNVDNSIRAQNEKFAKLLDPDDLPSQNGNRETKVDVVDVYKPNQEVQHIKVEDPITTMFRNVKRTIDFNLDLKIQNKIPRIDFIEMMEDSYQISIIEFLAEEFAEELLKNPNGLKKMISDKIRSLVYVDKKKTQLSEYVSEADVDKVSKKKAPTRKKSAIKKDKIDDTRTLS